MKEKILAAIKAKFPKVNLSMKRQNAIADFIIKKIIDDETKIDAAIDEYNDFNPLVELAKQDDKMRDLEAKLKISAPAKKDKDGKDVKDDDTPPPAPATPDDAPEWAKALIKQNGELVSRLSKIETEKATGTRKSQLETKLAKVPETIKNKILKDFDKMAFKDDDEFTNYLTETETDLAEFDQEQTNTGLGKQPKPVIGTGKGGKQEATKEEVDAVVKNIM